MHDILEGTAQLEIKLILNHFIEKGLITLQNINSRIKSFNYGVIHARDRPSIVILDKPGHLIGQKAGQTWCLMRFLPLIFTDIIESNPSEEWNIIISLLQIMSIVFAPRISHKQILELKELIFNHHLKFKTVFKKNLLPKHHFMVHYPRIMEMFGPLINLWCMRYEAKHGYFKNMAIKLRNYKSLAVTLATRHQEMFSQIGLCYSQTLECGTKKEVELKNYTHKNVIISQLEDFEDDFVIKIFSWVKLGYLYRTKFCLFEYSNDLSIFNEIVDILTIDTTIFFICQEWKTIEFIEKMHCFEIQKNVNADLKLICLNSLFYKEPFEIHQPYGSSKYVVSPKYVFC